MAEEESSVVSGRLFVAGRWAPAVRLSRCAIAFGLRTAKIALRTRGWQSLCETLTGGLRGRIRHSRAVTVPGEEREPEVSVIEFASTEEGMFVKEERNGETRISALNSEYAFDTTRSSAESPFQLASLHWGAGLPALEQAARGQWEPFLFSSFEIAGKTVPDLVSSEYFTLLSFDTDMVQNTATLTFSYSKPDKPDTAVTGGALKFAIDKQWAIESFDCSTTWGRMEGTVRYRPFEGCFLPEFCQQRSYAEGNDRSLQETYELEEIKKLAPHTRIAIRLEDYGLAKPKRKRKSKEQPKE